MKIIERFVKPIVLSILDTKKFVNEEFIDVKLSGLNGKIVDIEQKVNAKTISDINNLVNVVNDNKSTIEALSKRFILQSAKLEEVLIRVDSLEEVLSKVDDVVESISTVADNQQAFSNSIGSFDELLKTEIKKTRCDVAAVVKQTRDNVNDLKDKLDAFIDTISETISELKK